MINKAKALALQQDYDITVTARHMAITEAMKQHAIDKLSKIERYHTRIADVSITMDVQREMHKVDIVLKVNNFRLKSQGLATDMYVAIDMAVDKIQTQLRKYKNRLVQHHAKGLAEIDMTVNVLRPVDEVTEVNEEIEEENAKSLEKSYPHQEIIKQEVRPLKTLTHEEAMMKLELSGDMFLVFVHQDDLKLKVMYRRKDGNFGVIETEKTS